MATDIGLKKKIIDKERTEYLRLIIKELPKIYPQPIVLFYYKGLSYTELMEVFDLPMTVVKNRIYRAKIMLKRSMSEVNMDF